MPRSHAPKKSPVTQDLLHTLFSCDANEGILRRRVTQGKGIAGSHSTCKDRDGYLVVGVSRRIFRAHRLVWMYFYGEWPKADIDHINRIKDDNRLCNLRDVSRSQNKQNQGPTKRSRSGIKGVYPHRNGGKQTGLWAASIAHLGKNHFLGAYKSIDEAKAAYASAARLMHDFNPSAEK